MLNVIAKKVFGTRNERVIKSLYPLVVRVNDLERKVKAMSDEQLKNQTVLFKERLDRGESLDDIQAEAFAVVREASLRTRGLRHYDVQLIGGAILHKGMIAEMKTGEGKTLVATLPAYLNALSGKGVHIVTVNDYLAKRDAEWMGRIYNFLGLSVGCILPQQERSAKKTAYQADITYGQNNEFGFDYLRDNMRYKLEDIFQGGHNFAIVDEVDSILIDEARTPLIISGPSDDSTDKYLALDKLIPRLVKDRDYEIDLKSKNPSLTEEGINNVEKILNVGNLYDPEHIEILHHVNQALKAHVVFIKDVDYVVENGQVIIIDEFTGRKMPGRRWSDGLHQAVEAKEGLKVAAESQTLASITFQNYFRHYKKLAGMTGTADTEAAEFRKTYSLEVICIPPNKKMSRQDLSDKVFKTRREKYEAVLEEITEVHAKGQPILVGTISIEQSEALSKLLKNKGIQHNVLNAKYHEREAEIIAQAGRFNSVTISTNMAGRGTDILLGGNPDFLAAAESKTKDDSDPAYREALEKFKKLCEEDKEKVIKAGGLFIMGTERHESRRIDNQLRGRAGRQGDPGFSRFYVSLEDELMMRFGGERLQQLMTRFGMEEGMSLEGALMSRTIENAQKRVEGMHFDSRKQLLEIDDVMNKQRQVVYALRSRVLNNEDVRNEILTMIEDLLEDSTLSTCSDQIKPINWDIEQLKKRFSFLTNVDFDFSDSLRLDQQEIFDQLRKAAKEIYLEHSAEQESRLKSLQALSPNNPENTTTVVVRDTPDFTKVERDIFLETMDHFWLQHLQEMDHLKEGIFLRSYGQKNPVHEYQKEGFLMFQGMLSSMKEQVVRKLFFYHAPNADELLSHIQAEEMRRLEMEKKMKLVHQSTLGTNQAEAANIKDPELERARLLAAKKERRKYKSK